MSKLRELEKLLTEGKITRRTFIARVSAMGLMAAVSPAFLNEKAEAAAPKKAAGRYSALPEVRRQIPWIRGR